MADEASSRLFSQRHGYWSPPKEITVREDAPENLRYVLLETILQVEMHPHTARTVVCRLLRQREDPNNWSEFPNVWGEVEGHVYSCEWYRVYDLMEVIYEHLAGKAPEKAREFEHSLNSYFVEEGIGWQLVKGKVLARGSEVFESSVQKTVSVLEDSGRVTAKNEMHEALKDLSRRPTPDLTGAIQHAMASLECVAREVCGNPKATLGDILKHYTGIIPKPLDDAVEKAWGYASERGRHIREGREPERKEAELIVGIAATVATYLAQ